MLCDFVVAVENWTFDYYNAEIRFSPSLQGLLFLSVEGFAFVPPVF